MFFTEGLSIDNKIIKKGEIYVVTLTDNIATIELLIKLGFKRYVSEEGETVTMRIIKSAIIHVLKKNIITKGSEFFV